MIEKIKRYPIKYLNNLPFKTKLLMTYFILILVPLAIFTYLAYIRVSDVVAGQTIVSANQVFSEASLIINRDFNSAGTVFNTITHDNFIYTVASKNPRDYDIVSQLEDSNRITSTFNYLKETSGVDNIRFYANSSFIFSEENVNTFSIDSIKTSKFIKILSSQNKNSMWCPPAYFDDQPEGENHLFAATRIIYNTDYLSQKLGIIRVDLSESRMITALNNAAITPNTSVFIMDENNTVLTRSAIKEANNFTVSTAQLHSLPARQWNLITLGNQNVYINYDIIQSPEWYLVSVIPQDDIMATGKTLSNEMLIYAFILVSIAYLMAYIISYSSSKRLSLLTREMRKVEHGDLNVSLKKMGTDEIGELMENFNHMVSRTSELMDEKYKMGQEIKSAELKALQAQINPHFLYNSLDLINCIAIKHNIPDIITMVNALAKFYKLSLSKGRNVVSIRNELTHVELYVQIQNLRFENRIQLQIDVDEAIKEYNIIKILLQPIVENSILHGIFEKESKSGTISITGSLNEDTITLTVSDDGVGMTAEKQAEMLSGFSTTESHGYGISNINQRIKIFYGDEYGLTYKSTPGQGTEVTIVIPAQK